MPDEGRYAKMPRPESLIFFEERVKSYSLCIDIEKIDSQIYSILREDRSMLTVFVTNIYIVGEADVYDIVTSYPEVDTIVTISNWNSYSHAAKELAKTYGVALFKMTEFQGAIYYDGERYIDYEPPRRDKEDFGRGRYRW